MEAVQCSGGTPKQRRENERAAYPSWTGGPLVLFFRDTAHLAAAVVNAVIDYVPVSEDTAVYMAEGLRRACPPRSGIRFTGTVELMEKLRASYNSVECGGAREIVRGLQEAKLLVLDDLGAENPSEWVRERLFDIIDRRYNERTPTVITTNADVKELRQKLGARICDRIRAMCATYTVTSRSHRKTADNSQEEAGEGEDFDIPPDVKPKEKGMGWEAGTDRI